MELDRLDSTRQKALKIQLSHPQSTIRLLKQCLEPDPVHEDLAQEADSIFLFLISHLDEKGLWPLPDVSAIAHSPSELAKCLRFVAKEYQKWEKKEQWTVDGEWKNISNWHTSNKYYPDYSYVADAAEVAFMDARKELLGIAQTRPVDKETRAEYWKQLAYLA